MIVRNPFEPVLQIESLESELRSADGVVRVADRVSISIEAGEVLGLVGESGSGKSLLALTTLGLAPKSLRVVGGRIVFKGRDYVPNWPRSCETIRGSTATMVMQDPTASLNPVMRIDRQLYEPLMRHRPDLAKERRERAMSSLAALRVPDPARVLASYPHQLSGGMRQRVMLAIALSCEPDLLIADEPTTALDVSVQRELIDLLVNIKAKHQLAILFISHDLALVTQFCDRIAVMYQGRIVEQLSVKNGTVEARHPYTEALIECAGGWSTTTGRYPTIPDATPGIVPQTGACHYCARCPYFDPSCLNAALPWPDGTRRHVAACWKAEASPRA